MRIATEVAASHYKIWAIVPIGGTSRNTKRIVLVDKHHNGVAYTSARQEHVDEDILGDAAKYMKVSCEELRRLRDELAEGLETAAFFLRRPQLCNSA